MAYGYASCKVHVTIYSTGNKLLPFKKIYGVTCSYSSHLFLWALGLSNAIGRQNQGSGHGLDFGLNFELDYGLKSRQYTCQHLSDLAFGLPIDKGST